MREAMKNSCCKVNVQPQSELVKTISRQLNILPPLAQVLVNRGVENLEEARRFLYPDLSYLHDPFLLKDMDKAIEKIWSDLKNGRKILVYGDYDCDGITATALLVKALRHLGGDVDYYLPHRIEEGYGLHKNALQDIIKKGFETLITVDCGITSLEEVTLANAEGISVIVTDHHQPCGQLPPALAVIDPWRQDCTYPWQKLAGVGIAFKMVQALRGLGDCGDESEYLDLVALGTIADLVPLLGENRVLVKHGLEQLSRRTRPGLKALLNLCSVNQQEPITAWQVAFLIAPRLNAAGRMDNASPALQLLLTEEETEAVELANYLHAENERRQAMEQRVLKDAREMSEQVDPEEQVLVLARDGWHPGVLGIVASRITELYHKPSILIGFQEGIGKGSARSTEGFNIIEALNVCSRYLEAYGGHEMAAGLSIQKENLSSFRQAINKLSKGEKTTAVDPLARVDASLLPQDITLELGRQLRLLEPFGFDNPRPLFYSAGWKLRGSRFVGKKKNHLKMYLEKDGCLVEAIKFSKNSAQPLTVTPGRVMDFSFYLGSQLYQGKEYLSMELKDIFFSDEIKGQKILLFDRRGLPEKNSYLKELPLSTSLIFVNTRFREQQLASFAAGSSLYICHQGKIKEAPDSIKDLVFYDLPFREEHISNIFKTLSVIEKPLKVHCLYSFQDEKKNTKILAAFLPTAKSLFFVLKMIKEKADNDNPLQLDELWFKVKQIGFTRHAFHTSLAILQESSLLVRDRDQIWLPSDSLKPEQAMEKIRRTHSWQQIYRFWQESSRVQSFFLEKSAATIHRYLEKFI
ncbi:MAG: single-stranded-DNA-specific exonuclease RecJ [Firmicutes bacterium]|nr:single-stranded-DNA-specific exonuclease RecJ [Bacillota bacterium]